MSFPDEHLATRSWRLLIGGQEVHPARGGTLDVLDPARGGIVAKLPLGTTEDVDAAVDAAQQAFPGWRRTPIGERADRLLALAAAVESHGEELAQLDTIDSGSPIRVMRADYRLACETLRYFAGLALQLRGETIPTADPRSLDFTLREPYGVVARIVPFNHPLLFAASRIAAPLLAGNTVVLKPSEHTSMSALRLGELMAGVLPAGTVNVVTGTGAEVGDHLVRHPSVRRIAFTGGVEAGRRIQRSAAESGVKTVTLELGGKNPMIVFADAGVEEAVAGALRGMNFTWQGQSCGSTSRLLVHRSLFEPVTTALAAALQALVVGDPRDERTDVGALAYPAHFTRVSAYLEAGQLDPRLRLLTGGRVADPPSPHGLFLRPTLFVLDSDEEPPLVREEIFGPVLVAMPFDSVEEALARANRSPFGLTASVWTRDLGLALQASRELEAGYVWVNSASTHIAGSAFGGVKDSGVGREEGIEELFGFTQLKNVYIRY